MKDSGIHFILPAWLPWVALLAGVLAAGLVWLLRRKTSEKAALTITPAASPIEAPAEIPPPAVRWWTAENRRRPCFLVTGEAGAGTTALINGLTGYSHGGSKQAEWRVLQDCLLFDVPGHMFAGEDPSPWDRALRAVARRRPARPLESVTLTVAASSLSGNTRSVESWEAAGQTLRQRLDMLRRRIGFVLPVYVVVTRCDVLPGFRAFASALGEERRRDILGWSSDRRLDAAFSRAWVEEAFSQVDEALGASELGLFGSGAVTGSRREALLFPRELARLREPLACWLEPMFRASAGADPHFLRGIYFCGEDPSGNAPARAFTRDLFEQKVFREVRLARPAGAGTGSKSRWSLAGQITAAGLAAVLGGGLWWAYHRLSPIRDTRLEPLLEDLSQAVSGRAGTGDPGTVRAFNFLGALETLDVDGFSSVFLPASWSDPVGSRMDRVLAPAFQELVVESCRRGLEYRISGLTRTTAETPRAEGGEPESAARDLAEKFEDDPRYVRLQEYIRKASDLEVNLAAYDRLREREASGFDELNRLLDYLSGRPSARATRLESGRRYSRVFAEVQWPAVRNREAFRERAAERVRRLGGEFLAEWIGKSPLPQTIEELAELVGALEQGVDGGDAALERLEQRITQVTATLDTGSWDWATSDFDRARWGVLGKPLEKAPFTGEELVAALDAEGARRLELLEEALHKAANSTGGPVVEVEPGKIRVTGPVRALGSALVRLRSFAAVTTDASLPSTAGIGVGFLWDTAELREASGVEGAYTTFVRDTLPLLPERFRGPLRRLAAGRVRSATVAGIVRARTANPSPYRDGADPERSLLPEIRNLAEAAELFRDVSRGLENLGAPGEREKLRRLLAAQASGLLTALDWELNRRPPYATRLANWDDAAPLSLALFEARSQGELRHYLDSERSRIAALAVNYAQPLMTSFDKLGVDPAREQAERWRQIKEAMVSFAAAKPGNGIRALERFIEETADQVRPESGCTAPPAAAGTDIFTASERALRERAAELCKNALRGRYERMAEFFNARLAGRYPFTASPHPDEGPGVDPRDAGAFFQMLDKYGPALETVLAGEPGRKASEFLKRMAAIVPFFAIPQGDSAPVVSVAAEFRVNRAREAGGNQIMDWALRVGDHSITGPGGPGTAVRWRHGERTRLEFRYAKDSPWVPAPEAQGVNPAVNGRSVAFDFVHPWSLIQLLREYKSDAADVSSPAAAPNLLRFRIPNQTAAGGAAPASVIFVRLKLEPVKPAAAGAGGVPDLLSAEPVFPERAPGLAPVTKGGSSR
jgi:hypothetical protein